MIGWAVASFLLAACAMLLWTLLHERAEGKRLRAENQKLLATALEARGVMYVNPEESRKVSAVPVSRSTIHKVAGKLVSLTAQHQRMAEEREAQLRARIDESSIRPGDAGAVEG